VHAHSRANPFARTAGIVFGAASGAPPGDERAAVDAWLAWRGAMDGLPALDGAPLLAVRDAPAARMPCPGMQSDPPIS
jgi:hypothetical protein